MARLRVSWPANIKWKVSQNRPEPDRMGVVAGLLGREDEQSADMAALVRRHVSDQRS